MKSDREFLGKGWRFPVAVNLTGGISTSAYEDNVRESIFVILGTAPGERLNRPHWGCRIHDLMFAPNNHVTAALSEHFCEEALLKFEPRVGEVKVEARPSRDEPNRLNIRILYTVRETNAKHNLVYPFYLRQPDDET